MIGGFTSFPAFLDAAFVFSRCSATCRPSAQRAAEIFRDMDRSKAAGVGWVEAKIFQAGDWVVGWWFRNMFPYSGKMCF